MSNLKKNITYNFNQVNRLCLMILFVMVVFTYPNFAKTHNNKSIPVLLSSNATFYIKSLNALQSVLKRPVKLHYINYLTDETSRKTFFDKLKNQSPPIILSLGNSATKLTIKYIKNIPVVFSLVPSLKSINLQQSNICGISESINISQFFKVLKEIKPSARNVISFYKSKQGGYLAGEGEYADLKNQLLFRKFKINNLEELKKKLKALKNSGTVDAIYMVTDILYSRKVFEYLSKYSREKKIVLMSGFSSLIRLGATFGIVPDYTTLGITKGKFVNNILKNRESCANGKIKFIKRDRIKLNLSYAKKSNINIPQSLLTRQRAEQLFEVGVSLFQEKKYKSAKSVFVELKKVSPSFPLAKQYLTKVDNILVSELSLDLFEKAKRYVKKGNIRGAFIVMNEIRRRFKNSSTAKLRLQNLRSLLSHKETEEANKYLQKNKKFMAYRKFLSAIRFDKKNKLAQKQYQALLGKLLYSIPVMVKKGKVYYNLRRYYQAEQIFSNVLLIRPKHKIAIEYHRLSRQKREAIQRLLNCNKSKKKGCTLSW